MSQPPPMNEDPALIQIRRPPRRDEPLPPADAGTRAFPPAGNRLAAPVAEMAPADADRPGTPGAEARFATVERNTDQPRPPPIDDNLFRQQAANNPLVAAAAPILTLVCQLRGTLRHDDEPRLQWMVSEELKAFESRALQAEASPQDVIAARYVLCSLIDETVLSTPWGNQGSWASQTMLSQFHKETWGGEKVFVILDRIKGKPSRYLHLLELIGFCLALGFRGRYEVLENGMFRLDELRGEVWRIVRGQRAAAAGPLSPEFRVEKVQRSLVRYVPLWVVFALAGAMIVVTYVAFDYVLMQNLDGAAASLVQASPHR